MKNPRRKILLLAIVLMHTILANTASTSPEKIKAGILYYADEYEIKDKVAALGEERNYEEVFKNYNYYEAAYDEEKRIIVFRAYKKGEVEWEEIYTYHTNGKLASKKTIGPGKTEKFEEFPEIKNKENIK